MGANNLLIMPGASTANGVSMGSSSVMTLKPEDAHEMLRQCSAVSQGGALSAKLARRSFTATAIGFPCTSMAPRPRFWKFANWEHLSEGDVFTDRDVPQREQGVPDRPDPWHGNCFKESRRSIRKSACRMCRSVSSEVIAALVRAPNMMGKRPGRYRASRRGRRSNIGSVARL